MKMITEPFSRIYLMPSFKKIPILCSRVLNLKAPNTPFIPNFRLLGKRVRRALDHLNAKREYERAHGESGTNMHKRVVDVDTKRKDGVSPTKLNGGCVEDRR